NAGKVATERLATFPNHFAMIAHREGDGQAELHEKQADLFVVTSGEATLVYGGEVVSPKTTEPNEVRGPSIKGGEKKALAPAAAARLAHVVPARVLRDQRAPELARARQGQDRRDVSVARLLRDPVQLDPRPRAGGAPVERAVLLVLRVHPYEGGRGDPLLVQDGEDVHGRPAVPGVAVDAQPCAPMAERGRRGQLL